MKRIMIISLAGVLLAGLVLGVRQAAARRAIEQELNTPPVNVPPLETTTRLEILPLYEEASTKPDLLSGHGVSYLIRTDGSTILLDVGNNPDHQEPAPFIHNMQALGIEWDEVDWIVISHAHPDHIGGLNAWLRRTISFGELPGGMGERLVFVPSVVTNKGAIHTTIPTRPSPDVATTGAIPYPESWPFSLRNPKGYEQALVIHVAGQGLVLITGCGHPTLEKLVERAESYYGQPVVGVVGGLHYEGMSADAVQPDIQFLQSRQPRLVALSPHDSSPKALSTFEHALGDSYYTLKVGEVIRFSGE